MRGFLGSALLVGLALSASSSSACVRITSWYAVAQTTPADASAGVPLNAPIVVRFAATTFAGNAAPGSIAPGYSVTRATLSGGVEQAPSVLRKVELASDPAIPPYASTSLLTAFVPDMPLLANTQYTIAVGENIDVPNPSVPPDTSWSFTSGSGFREPLSVAGDLAVSFEAGSVPHMDCELPLQTLCGGATCTQKGTDDVTMARVILPAVVDGFADQFLKGRLTVYDAADDTKQLTNLLEPELTAGQATEELLTLPLNAAGQTYVPCIEFRVSDARGDEASSSWCADEPFPHPADNHHAPKLSSGPHTSSACSISLLAPSHGSRDCGALVVVLAALSLRSWRRRRSAP